MHPAFKTFGGLNLPTIPHSALCSTNARTRHCTAPSPSCAWALILWLTSYGVIYLPQEDSFPRACLLSTHYFLTSPYGALHSSQFLEQSGCTCTFDMEMQTALCQRWLLMRLQPLEPQALLMPRHCWTCTDHCDCSTAQRWKGPWSPSLHLHRKNLQPTIYSLVYLQINSQHSLICIYRGIQIVFSIWI